MRKFFRHESCGMVLFVVLVAALVAVPSAWTGGGVLRAAEVPVNVWTRVADAPGDALGREVPPGRGATWEYAPTTRKFYRYGGYTPRHSNAMDTFDPASLQWERVVREDENYPSDRPAGVTEAQLVWDATINKLWILGGIQRSVAVGKPGFWLYDPKTGIFELENDELGRHTRFAFDPKRRLIVGAPNFAIAARDATRVYSLAERKWDTKRTNPSPQHTYAGNWPVIYDPTIDRVLSFDAHDGNKDQKMIVWAFDLDTFTWEIINDGASGAAPSIKRRRNFTVALDPMNGGVLLHGGSDGREDDQFAVGNVWNDTWFFDSKTKKWTELTIAGPTPLKGVNRGKRLAGITYRKALSFDSTRKQMLLSDPDLGVWALRYVPGQPFPAAGESDAFVEVGEAAANAPAKASAPERFLEIKDDLNPRILELADNTSVELQNVGMSGAEIPWDYDWKNGLFVKYGGCGNGNSPFWGGYGNDLTYYNPRTELIHVRRPSDVSGSHRPGVGCTRSVIYDSHRKLVWFYGGTAATPAPAVSGKWQGRKGTWAYDYATDRFELMQPQGESARGPFGHAAYMVYDPDHRCIVAPGEGKTLIFDTTKAVWIERDTPSSPSAMVNYTRLAYVHSLKGTLRLAEVLSGKTSAEQPAEALSAKDTVTNKATVFWKENKKEKRWEEWTMKTLLYDYDANEWKDLAPKGLPPFRNNKYGLAYDAVNDVVILVGGHINWNGPVAANLWVYDVKSNAWMEMQPQGDKITYGGALRTVYDPRHNATLIGHEGSGHRLVAYRYKRGVLPAGIMEKMLAD